MQGPFTHRPARIEQFVRRSDSLMHNWIEEGDDVAVDFHAIGDQDGIFVDPQNAFRDAGLAVAGAAVQE